MKWHRPRTLFGRTALTLGVALVLLQTLAISIIALQVAYPLGQRATDDLAGLMVLAAQSWAELPPMTRPDFERELATNHGLRIVTAPASLPTGKSYLPYQFLLEAALARHVGQPVPIRATSNPDWHWADIPVNDQRIHVGFSHDRVRLQPPLVLTLLIIAITGLTLITAFILARRLTRPLAQLALAATKVGQGKTPAPIPEQGPEELAQLARRFNRMAEDVRELLENRTTLLSGISHDLRTPLARMQLALEMLPRATDPKLVDGLRRDIEEMNHLIGQFLELGRGLQTEELVAIDLQTVLNEIVVDTRRSGVDIHLSATESCIIPLNASALRRVLTNLIENAVRYSESKPIDVELVNSDDGVMIRVLDRGPGIPESARGAVFRPFYRLEPSRSSITGGSGLGLAIARQLAQANGWRIELLARTGGGTEARLVLTLPSRV